VDRSLAIGRSLSSGSSKIYADADWSFDVVVAGGEEGADVVVVVPPGPFSYDAYAWPSSSQEISSYPRGLPVGSGHRSHPRTLALLFSALPHPVIGGARSDVEPDVGALPNVSGRAVEGHSEFHPRPIPLPVGPLLPKCWMSLLYVHLLSLPSVLPRASSHRLG